MDNRRLNYHSSILQVASIIKNKDHLKEKESSEAEGKKRDRNANYSKAETNKLVDIALTKSDTLENKSKKKDSWAEKKKVWKEIEREFNETLEVDGIYRDRKTLKLKYDSMKSNVKQKWIRYMKMRNDSSEKPPKFTAAERKIRDLLLPSMEGFCDFATVDVQNIIKYNSNDVSAESGDESDIDIEPLLPSNVKSKENEEYETSDEGITQNEITTNKYEPAAKKVRNTSFVGIRENQDSNSDQSSLETDKLQRRLQIEMLKEELEIKKLQRKMLEQEMEHKQVIHELEKEHLLTKIKALKEKNKLISNT